MIMHEIFLFPKENVTFDLSTSLTIGWEQIIFGVNEP